MSHRDPVARSAYNLAYRLADREAKLVRRRERYAANLERERARNKATYAAKRPAMLARATAYRAAHHEACLETTRRWREANAEAIEAKRAADYAANPEYFRAKARAHYRRHPEKMKAKNATRDKAAEVKRARAWQRKHPEQVHAAKARRRALEAQAPVNDFTAAQWREIKTAYGHRCVYCHRQLQRLTQDHITPLFYGGSHTASNIVPACVSCNSKKRIGPPLTAIQPVLVLCAPARQEEDKQYA